MKRIILTFIIFCHATLMIAQVQTARKTSGGRGYLEYLPESYSSSSNFPCIIFLHGSGERGDGSPAALEKLKAQGIPKFIANGSNMCFTANGKTECFVVLSPQQTTARWGWQGDVIPFIQYALANYKIDPDRIYITGLSMGGDGSWDTSYDTKNEPNYIAAISPVSCKGDYNGAKSTAAKKIAVWAFHGDKDTTVPVSDGQRPVNGMISVSANPAPIFTLVAGGTHSGSTWDKVYSPTHTYYNPNMYEWFLTKKRVGSNAAPVANAGTDKQITLPASSIVLQGSGTDSDGQIAAYSWTQAAGPNTATLSGQTTSSLNVTNCIAGQYTFRLTVTDNLGKTASDDVLVNVVKANAAPVANAGADQQITLPTTSLSIAGVGTDSDGQITSYSWAQATGPNTATLSGASNSVLSISNCVQGQYVFNLTVTDNQNTTATDAVTVNVISGTNQAPIVNAGSDITVQFPTLTFNLTAVASDPDGSIASYAWTQTWGATSTITNATTATPTIATPGIGNYTFRVTATDNKGLKTTDDIKITVIKARPVANAGVDKQITLPTNTVTLNGTGTDADGTITTYAWIQTSGPVTAVIANPATSTTNVSSLTTSGDYIFMLTVTDNDNQSVSDYVRITVSAASQNVASVGAGVTTLSVAESTGETETTTSLGQNYPNPFVNSTTIPFTLAHDQQVVLKVYDFAGVEIATLVNEPLKAGSHEIVYTPAGSALGRGLYIFKLFTEDGILFTKGSIQ